MQASACMTAKESKDNEIDTCYRMIVLKTDGPSATPLKNLPHPEKEAMAGRYREHLEIRAHRGNVHVSPSWKIRPHPPSVNSPDAKHMEPKRVRTSEQATKKVISAGSDVGPTTPIGAIEYYT